MLDVAVWVLYGVAWFLGVVVWGGTADKLDVGGKCYFGKGSSCGAIVFFGLISWLALSFLLSMRIAERFDSKYELPLLLELRSFIVLSSIWGLVALISAITSPDRHRTSTGIAVVAFAWINLLVHLLATGFSVLRHRIEMSVI
eukprot:IDg11862t1